MFKYKFVLIATEKHVTLIHAKGFLCLNSFNEFIVQHSYNGTAE